MNNSNTGWGSIAACELPQIQMQCALMYKPCCVAMPMLCCHQQCMSGTWIQIYWCWIEDYVEASFSPLHTHLDMSTNTAAKRTVCGLSLATSAAELVRLCLQGQEGVGQGRQGPWLREGGGVRAPTATAASEQSGLNGCPSLTSSSRSECTARGLVNQTKCSQSIWLGQSMCSSLISLCSRECTANGLVDQISCSWGIMFSNCEHLNRKWVNCDGLSNKLTAFVGCNLGTMWTVSTLSTVGSQNMLASLTRLYESECRLLLPVLVCVLSCKHVDQLADNQTSRTQFLQYPRLGPTYLKWKDSATECGLAGCCMLQNSCWGTSVWISWQTTWTAQTPLMQHTRQPSQYHYEPSLPTGGAAGYCCLWWCLCSAASASIR